MESLREAVGMAEHRLSKSVVIVEYLILVDIEINRFNVLECKCILNLCGNG